MFDEERYTELKSQGLSEKDIAMDMDCDDVLVLRLRRSISKGEDYILHEIRKIEKALDEGYSVCYYDCPAPLRYILESFLYEDGYRVRKERGKHVAYKKGVPTKSTLTVWQIVEKEEF